MIFKRKHNWLMCWLYVGTFGSFIGFSAGFAMLTKTLFPQVDPTAYAFLGPLVGSLTRPLGGWVSDKLGGARVTLFTFVGMIAAVLGVMMFMPVNGQGGDFNGFLAMFIVLFALTGVGNGSTFRMIPVIFLRERTQAAEAGARPGASRRWPRPPRIGGGAGLSGAIGAYGGFFIPRSFGTSLELTGGAQAALYCFIAFYATCVLITWWQYAPATRRCRAEQ